MQALEFQISAVWVNPKKGSLSFGCTLGASTPGGSFAARALRAAAPGLGADGRHGAILLLGLLRRRGPWTDKDGEERLHLAAIAGGRSSPPVRASAVGT